MLIYCLSIFFGAASSIILGKFIGVSFAGIYSLLIIALIGAAIGGITAPKIVAKDHTGKNFRGIISVCFSLWFGITAGLILGAVLAQITILPLFVYRLGNPETTPWPAASASTFLILVVAMTIACGLGMGAWFFNNTLKSRFPADEPGPLDSENGADTPAVFPEQIESAASDDRQDRPVR